MTTDQLVAGTAATAPKAAAPWRSLEEVKQELMRRAGRLSPFEDIRREDAERVIGALTSLDRDLWARLWSRIGLDYEAKADARAREGAPGQELAELYTLAFDYCRIGRYPVPSTPGKQESYAHSLRLFRKAARHFEPALTIVELPFEGKTLVGYLQLPPGVAKAPVVMHWGGVDGWKEDRLRAAAFILRTGLASLTIDMPGTGENPVRYGDPAAERTYSAWLDHWRSAATSTAAASRSGAAASAPTGRRGSPTWRRSGSEARCSTAATCITASRRNGWCRPSPPAAPPICSAPAACSRRAAAPWAPPRRRNF